VLWGLGPFLRDHSLATGVRPIQLLPRVSADGSHSALCFDEFGPAHDYCRGVPVHPDLPQPEADALIPGKQYTPEIILGIAWRYKWVILIPAVLIATGVVMWTRTLIDMYSSEVMILVVPQQVARDYVKSTVTASAAERVQTLSQQILSRSRLEKIVTELNLY